jgi:superfamily II DNA or RNA helicase
LADRKELCTQAVESFKEVWQHVGKSNLTLHRFWEEHDPPSKITAPVFMVATLAKAINHLRKHATLIKADLIIFDEAHHMLAPKYYNCVRHLGALTSRVIGLSATPGRGYLHLHENFELAKIFWNNIITINSGKEGPITFLQRKGILAVAEKVRIEFYDPNFHLSNEEWKHIVADSEFPESVVKKLATNYIRNLKIAEKLKKLGDERKQVLFFGASVEHSRWLFAIAKYFGFSAAHIENSTPSTYRKDIVDKFRRGKINFIFNYDIFTTGFDAPNIDVVFIARPTKSYITFLQMIGRGMRGPLMGGTDKFDLVYIEDKVFEDINLDNLYESFGDYFGEYS